MPLDDAARAQGPPSRLLTLGLVAHGLVEGIAGIMMLSNPSTFFPDYAKHGFLSLEASVVRCFAMNIIVQGAMCLAALRWPAHCQKRLLFVAIGYHTAIVIDRLYGRMMGSAAEDPMFMVIPLHSAMVGLLLPLVLMAWRNMYAKERAKKALSEGKSQ